MQKYSITLRPFSSKGMVSFVEKEYSYYLHFYISLFVNALGALGRPVMLPAHLLLSPSAVTFEAKANFSEI